jgi:hypothetical protein
MGLHVQTSRQSPGSAASESQRRISGTSDVATLCTCRLLRMFCRLPNWFAAIAKGWVAGATPQARETCWGDAPHTPPSAAKPL